MKKMLSLLAFTMLLAPTFAHAASIDFDMVLTFSNNVLPGGPPPWVHVNINDATAQAGYDARVTITTPGLTASEFISEVSLNLNPALNPLNLQGALVQDTASQAFAGGAAGPDAFKADGVGGFFDIIFNFKTNDGNRFTDGMTFVFDLNNSTGGLLASDFNFGATGSGYFAAAHLQSIGDGSSTWLASNGTSGTPDPRNSPVPEPASMLLVGTGLLAAFRKRLVRR